MFHTIYRIYYYRKELVIKFIIFRKENENMKSTDNNISSTSKQWLDIREDYFFNAYGTAYCDKENYDLISVHDPNTVYVIIDSPTCDMYLGDCKIPKPSHERMYLMTYDEDDDKYIIYLNLISNFRDNLVPVCRFKDPQEALDALHQYTCVGWHTNMARNIYMSIINYVDEVYGINEAIISMITCFGYSNDPRLQYLCEEAISYGVENDARDLPQYYRAALHNLRTGKPDSLIVLYSDIYDVFVKYNWFKDSKDENLSAEVNDIIDVARKYAFTRIY